MKKKKYEEKILNYTKTEVKNLMSKNIREPINEREKVYKKLKSLIKELLKNDISFEIYFKGELYLLIKKESGKVKVEGLYNQLEGEVASSPLDLLPLNILNNLAEYISERRPYFDEGDSITINLYSHYHKGKKELTALYREFDKSGKPKMKSAIIGTLVYDKEIGWVDKETRNWHLNF